MDKIEYLRQELHNVIESGDQRAILAVSQKLDLLIVKCMLRQLCTQKKYVS
ncbi:MAG: Spo0E family sporulation regulatory protein-aspartic acid phosphatase [Clostridium sp.]|nr:Spo0E family sporulation regulatory protein-aspartic acid phosphatase [Clostridium sp.]